MQEHHLTVPRTARYFTLGEPGPRARELWLVCHGYGQLAGRFLRHFAPLDDGTRLIVAPEGLSRFYVGEVTGVPAAERRVGATWMTREDRLAEIGDYVAYLDALCVHVLRELDRKEVAVRALGFSQGTATVARWAVQGRGRVDRVILWAGGLPSDLDWARAREVFARTGLTIVLGTHDSHITPERVAEERARLAAEGIPYRLVTFEGGHEIDEETLRRLASE